MSPLIQNIIMAAVNAATTNMKTTIVDKMVKSNEELQKLVKEHSKPVKFQKIIINKQKDLTGGQNYPLEGKSASFEQLECDAEYMMLEWIL